jgi:hypothetical protein
MKKKYNIKLSNMLTIYMIIDSLLLGSLESYTLFTIHNNGNITDVGLRSSMSFFREFFLDVFTTHLTDGLEKTLAVLFANAKIAGFDAITTTATK